MTIDEAIQHCEEVAKEQDKLCKRYDDASGYTRSHNEDIRTTDAKKCIKCAKEHRQLAEWLKELKQLREQEPILDKIRAEIVDTLYVDSLIFGELIDFRNGKISADDVIEEFNRVTRLEVLQILDKYKESEEV